MHGHMWYVCCSGKCTGLLCASLLRIAFNIINFRYLRNDIWAASALMLIISFDVPQFSSDCACNLLLCPLEPPWLLGLQLNVVIYLHLRISRRHAFLHTYLLIIRMHCVRLDMAFPLDSPKDEIFFIQATLSESQSERKIVWARTVLIRECIKKFKFYWCHCSNEDKSRTYTQSKVGIIFSL